MPYVYIGHPSIYHGKRLFKILCQLKKMGQNRIVYRTTEQNHPEPSFYRILLAQPEMDPNFELGRVVAERVFRGRKYLTPYNLTEEAKYPDFKLVSKEQEEEFCRWNEIKPFEHSRDAEPKPKFIEIPPLLKLYLERNRASHGEEMNDHDVVLPAHKIYEGEYRLVDRVEPNSMEKHITGRFSDFQDFDVNRVPNWNLEYQTQRGLGYRAYLQKIEGTKDYIKWQERNS